MEKLLPLNTSKLKVLTVDIRRCKLNIQPITINGNRVEIYQATGTYVSEDLTWSVNSASFLKKKGHNRDSTSWGFSGRTTRELSL